MSAWLGGERKTVETPVPPQEKVMVRGLRRYITTHLTPPSFRIQVTGAYTVKTVKSTREKRPKDAASPFQAEPGAPLKHRGGPADKVLIGKRLPHGLTC